MFNQFKNKFSVYTTVANVPISITDVPFKYAELLLEMGGTTFNKGLYSIHTFESSLKWADILSKYFQGYKNEILPFAYDWWGRQYAVSKQGHEGIYVFDPVDLGDYLIDGNIIDFHNSTLTQDIELLDNVLFQDELKFLAVDGLSPFKAIGYKIPLFLNGKANLVNTEIVDGEIYWALQYQMYEQVKNLPDGTRISNVGIIPGFKYDT